MGNLFQAECWENHPSGCSFKLILLWKLAKAKAKALERKNGIFGTFIDEK